MSDHAYQILVLAGPSGAGKSTLIKHLLQNLPNVYFSISTTTRPKREGEIEGQHYYFVSQESFLEGIQNGQFLEWARVYDDYYGTSLKPIQEALQAKQLVLFDIDVQGHRSIRKIYPQATSIFITTKNAQVLQDRLEKRQTDSPAVIARRMESAFKELQEVDLFDYVLINDNFEEAKEMVLSVAKTLRYKQQMFPKDALYRAWSGN
ncbi:Guanylate kinase [Helicobacter bizzozeronii CIII-1]|uniref:Guanylate kinase n=1 Tax=Helicobacter bizzozeronii (strain CIII-1) TaxID=1002804 RepID=F8KTC3_HELBC|nr:guanylate kinase [Helicobacter bizzozeronii]CCB80074.1 Guanylate kinase [Helicobacter bizzozeronii CIII-1]